VSNFEGLCTLVPVAEGHEDELRDHLERLPDGPRSPMIRVHGTHYARWAIVHLEGRDGGPIRAEPPYLLFAAEFDGDVEEYSRRLCAGLGSDARDIWRHCVGYPGDDPIALAGFLLAHRVGPGYSVVAYADATVERVRAAFALRERLNDFLVRTADLDSRALKYAWQNRFRGWGR
jgi:hypothetical protein